MNEEKIKSFLSHSLFVHARQDFNKAQARQIEKAVQKYDEPLNPDSWKPYQLHWHAMEELVDLAHYLQAMKIKFQDIQTLLKRIDALAEEALTTNDIIDARCNLRLIRDLLAEMKL